MIYQNKPGFYTYHYDILGNLQTSYFPRLEDFFRIHSEYFIKISFVMEIFKHDNQLIISEYFTSYKTIICAETGNSIRPDNLIGLYRKWYADRWSQFNRARYQPGFKRRVYCGYRSIHTFPEKREWFNVDEYNIRGRYRRSKSMLIDTWDDIIRHNDKSWKTQSKRKHQYIR